MESTLTSMARGGIYDQAGGGFARYSVDPIWKVPHFEKMLYDNAQLLGLYAHAYQVFGRESFLDVIRQTIGFLQREMVSSEGLFYSALDADSDGEEGKYYGWSREELEDILEGDFDLFADYYNINSTGIWEHNKYILFRTSDVDSFAREQGMSPGSLRERISKWHKILLEARAGRVRPELDDKSLTSWNAMMISGLVNAYRATGDPGILEMAARCGNTIRQKLWSKEKVLYRNYKEDRRSIPGFHTDYALFIEACLNLYEVSMESHWLELAKDLTGATYEKFFDPGSGMFHYNSRDTEVLITHHIEVQDNVIPSSNSVMALNLFRLGHHLVKREYLEQSASMLDRMKGRIIQYPNGFAGWGNLLLKQQHPFYEIAVVGPDAEKILLELGREYLPNAILTGTDTENDLPLFRDRYQKDKTHIFVCMDNVCQLPVNNPEDAKAIYHQ